MSVAFDMSRLAQEFIAVESRMCVPCLLAPGEFMIFWSAVEGSVQNQIALNSVPVLTSKTAAAAVAAAALYSQCPLLSQQQTITILCS